MKKFLQRFVMMGFTVAMLFLGAKVDAIEVDVSSYAWFVDQYNSRSGNLTLNISTAAIIINTGVLNSSPSWTSLVVRASYTYNFNPNNVAILYGNNNSGFVLLNHDNRKDMTFNDIIFDKFHSTYGSNANSSLGGAVISAKNISVSFDMGIVSFVNNTIVHSTSTQSTPGIFGGGAIFIGSYNQTQSDLFFGGSTVSFKNNRAEFSGKDNYAYDINGGAIFALGSSIIFNSNYVSFEKNTVYAKGRVSEGGEWEGTNARGGAIFNQGINDSGQSISLQSVLEFLDNNGIVEFKENIAKSDSTNLSISRGGDAEGGAIFVQWGGLRFHNANVLFEKNQAIGSNARGGAIDINGHSNVDQGRHVVFRIEISTILFKNNEAIAQQGGGEVNAMGGAIEISRATGTIIESDIIFLNNKGTSSKLGMGGAINVEDSKVDFVGNRIDFSSNSMSAYLVMGGATNFSGEVMFSGNKVKYAGNSASGVYGLGGAIFTLNLTEAATKLDFLGGNISFTSNRAAYGGAIYISVNSRVKIEDATFNNNEASSLGGAIYITGQDSVLTNAMSAIYENMTFGIHYSSLTISAVKSDVIFTGNKANGKVNDIYMEKYAGLIFHTENGKKIDLQGGIFVKEATGNRIDKTGEGNLNLSGINNLKGELYIEGGAVNITGQEFSVNLKSLTVVNGSTYSVLDDQAGQITNVESASIDGALLLDVDFGSGQSDKLLVSGDFMSSGSNPRIFINGFGNGYEKEIIVVLGSRILGVGNSEPLEILFSELNKIKYESSIYMSSITVRAKTAAPVKTTDELETAMGNDDFFVEFTKPNITLNDTVIKTGVVYGNGNSIDGKGGDGLSIETNKAVEFNDLNVKNFTENTAIAVVDGSVLTIAANSKDVSFAGNKEDLSLTKEAIVNIETRNNHNVSFGSGISGDVGSKIDKKGDGTLVLDGNVAFSGNMNIGQGAVQISTEVVNISTLTITSNGKYSTADGKTHTTYVDYAQMSGILEIGISVGNTNIISVSSTIVISPGATWNILPFGNGITSGLQIALMQTKEGVIIGIENIDETKIYSKELNGITIQYQIYTKDIGNSFSYGAIPGNALDLNLTGIYARILGVSGGIGLNTAFIANSIRLGALSNNGNVYANINNDVWVAGVVNGQNLKDSVNKDFESNGYGVQAGAMIYLDENRTRTITGGLFAGFNTKSLKEGEDKADANDIELGTYWGYKTQKVNVMGSLSGGFQSISAKNEEAKAKADFNTYSIRLGAEAEYLLGIWKPYIGIAGGYVSSGKIEEKIDGKVKGTIDADSYLRLETIAGIKIEKEVGSTLLSAKAHLGYLAVGEKPEYKAEDVTIYGTKEDPLSAGVGIGIEYAVSKKVSIFLNGDTNFGKDLFGYYGNLGGRYKF